MSEKQFDFSIRMDKENSTPELEPFDITVTPDTKGPKSVAILMFSEVYLILLAFGDFQLSQQEDLTDEEIEIILETPNADLDTDISNDDYQKFHDSARQGYLIRAAGLAISGSLIVLGAFALFTQ